MKEVTQPQPIVETSVATLEKRGDGIIEMRFMDEYLVEEDHFEEIELAFKKLTNGLEGYKALVIPGPYGAITKEAREKDVYAGNPAKLCALAIVVPYLHQKIFGKAFFKFVTKPPYPYEFFHKKENAEEWLMNK